MFVASQIPSATRSDSSFFSKYAALLDISLRVGDLFIVAISACAVYAAQFQAFRVDSSYRTGIILAVLLTMLIFPVCNIYRSWRGESLVMEVLRLWMAWAAVFAALFALNWIMKTTESYSRLWVGGWFATGMMLFAISRFAARRFLGFVRRHGVDTRRVILVGATYAGQKMVDAARGNSWMGLEVIGYVETKHDQTRIDHLPRLGSLDDFVSTIATSSDYEQLWIALPMRAEQSIRRVTDAVSDSTATIRLVPDLFGYELLNRQSTEVAGIPVITLRGSRVSGHARIVKAVEDRILSTLILLLISPIMIILALGVKLSSRGPIFYRQKRVGLDGQEFEMLKFRSMPVDAEKDGLKWGSAKQKKTTKFGRFMRKTSLDELPQFINVLKGDMSIVGPRPERSAFVNEFRKDIPKYMQKHIVKAGITGWAQINGWRGDTDLRKRIESDLYYINNWSIGFDMRIILSTVIRGFFSKNAY